jgi:chemotaxis signal transduction protein
MSEAIQTEQQNPEQLQPLLAEQVDAAQPEERGPERQYCIFRAGRERFCIPVQDVEEVVEWPTVTRVPLAPSFLMGIFNLRGAIVPIVDIAFTEIRRPDLQPRHVVVGVLAAHGEHDEIRIGIAADEVIGTYTTPDALLVDEAPREVPHCCGMLRHDDKLALALDLKRVTEVFPVPVI